MIFPQTAKQRVEEINARMEYFRKKHKIRKWLGDEDFWNVVAELALKDLALSKELEDMGDEWEEAWKAYMQEENM